MSATYTATGIVLGWSDHREADRWYSLYTQEHGKIECVARGSHKPLAKLSPHLEVPAELSLMLVHGRQYDLIAGVERIRSFGGVQSDLSRLILARSALHLVDIGVRPEEADRGIYELLIEWLADLETGAVPTAERSGYMLGSFALKLLDAVGYRPELSQCLSCRQALVAGSFRWHALKGGTACRACTERDAEPWFSARSMSDEALKLLRFALGQAFVEQRRPHLSGAALGEFHEAVESLIIAHFPTIPANSLRAACAMV